MHKPVEEDIITFTQVEIKHFMPEWIPNEKKYTRQEYSLLNKRI